MIATNDDRAAVAQIKDDRHEKMIGHGKNPEHRVLARKIQAAIGGGNAFQCELIGPATERLLEVRPGEDVLDVACGRGRHAIAAAARGAEVVALDADVEHLRAAEKTARKAGVPVEWQQADLEHDPLPPGLFDLVMVFNYLDRTRMPQMLAAVRPGLEETLRLFAEALAQDEVVVKGAELQFVRVVLSLVRS